MKHVVAGLVRAFDPPSQVTTKHGQKEASLDTAENAFSECVTGKKCAAPAPGKRFCVGCEGSLVYCYGSDYGCLWGRCIACVDVHETTRIVVA